MIQKHGVIHSHTLKRAYKKTRFKDSTRFMLLWICTTCPFKQAYDLVATLPGGSN